MIKIVAGKKRFFDTIVVLSCSFFYRLKRPSFFVSLKTSYCSAIATSLYHKMSDPVELRKFTSCSDQFQLVMKRCDKIEAIMQKLVKEGHDDFNRTDAGEFIAKEEENGLPLGKAKPAFSAPDINCQQAATDCHIIDTPIIGIFLLFSPL